MRGQAMVAVALALAPQAAAAISVHVDAGALTASVSQALRAERASIDLVEAASEADLIVAVSDAGGAYRLEATSGAARVIARQIEKSDVIAPAVRLIVLLVVEAIDGLDASPPPRAWALSASAGLGVAWWASPGGPVLTLSARGSLLLFDGRLAVDAGLNALPCCALSTPQVVDVTPWAVGGLVEVAYAVIRGPVLDLRGLLGAGVTWRNVSTIALAFAAPGPVETGGALELSVRAGVGARWPFAERWALEARAGAELRPNRLRVTLPPPYAAGEHAVDPGVITPFAELAVGVQIF